MSEQPDEEVAALRAEVEQLRADLRATERECEILHSLNNGIASRSGNRTVSRPPVQIGSRERMAMLEHAIELLDGFVREAATYDCYDYDCGKNDEGECLCTPCRAKSIVETIADWRYGGSPTTPSRRFEGAMHYRTSNGWNPREAKIHTAWAKYMGTRGPDRVLGLILTDRSPGQPEGIRDWPSARDWYVATSIVQWLATNCGSSILQEAGWKYTKYDEDRMSLDAMRESVDSAKTSIAIANTIA
jgi:hypothetical protein